MKPASITSKRGVGKWGLPAILICGLAGFFATGLHQLISWETVARHYAEISHFIEQNRTASYLGFVLFYTAVVAFSLPIASLLTLAAGALLGWPAIGLIVVAATAGASLLFIAARGLFRDVLRARAGPFFAKLEAGFTKNAFGYLLFLRLMPAAPFWAVNILPAFSGMRLAPFIGATAIGIIPGTVSKEQAEATKQNPPAAAKSRQPQQPKQQDDSDFHQNYQKIQAEIKKQK